MSIPPSIHFVLRYHDRYGFVNFINSPQYLFRRFKAGDDFWNLETGPYGFPWQRIELLTNAIYEVFKPIEAIVMTVKEWEKGESVIADFARSGEVVFAA